MAEQSTKLTVKKGAEPAPPATWRSGSLRDEINRLFDEFNSGFGQWPLPRSFFGSEEIARARANVPAVDIAETDKAFEVSAELPGMSDKDVTVELVNGDLRIKGEKKEEREEKNKDYYLSERSYGAFERRFRVPEGVDTDKIEASFKKGVLTVTLPKSPEAVKSEKKIAVKAS